MHRPKPFAVLVFSTAIVAVCGVGSGTAHAARAESVARAVSMALGGEHSCALTNAGDVRCWGWNNDGQLGDGTSNSHSIAVDVGGLHMPISQITAGYNHSCALTSAGEVQCWGANANGQLGVLTDGCGTFACSLVPVDVGGLASATAIAAGFAHTCAVTAGAGLMCWGFNLYGQLGDGTMIDRDEPAFVTGLEAGVAKVAPGDVQTCALKQDATVRCWGNSLLGELGNGARVASLTPVTVCSTSSCEQPLAGIVQLSAGDHHTCALTSAGEVYCWGSNIVGQLGVAAPEGCPDAGRPCSTRPVRVPLADTATAVSAATATTCALLEDGAVECWGQQSGSTRIWASPTAVEGWSSGITVVATANGHACAIIDEDELYCFGENNYGQLGDGTLVDRDAGAPSRVWTLSGRGDADCNMNISSVDALLVLQLVAELVQALPCPNAASAADAPITSKDALAVLQFSAGLLT